MGDSYDVVVVGSCMIDLICYAPRLPKCGETLCGTKFSTGFGGKGCNQCVAAKKLGADSLLVARIGNDFFGERYLNKLKEYQIPTEHVKSTEGVATGTAQITVADSGENQIVIVMGANEELTEADIIEAEDFIVKSKVMVCQLEVPESTTVKALKMKAEGKRGKSIFNAAPAKPEINPLLYSLPDIFCVNETEAETLTGQRIVNVDDAKIAVDHLLGKGCKEIIITLGEEGAVYGSKSTKAHIPTIKVTAVDTTGAGDAFIGALAYYLSTQPNKSMEDIIKLSNTAASYSVTKLGTQESFPLLNDILI